jgi:outer membrane receptor protein involved in Fe transport
VEEDKISPKTGFTWTPNSTLTFRAAWLQNIKRPFSGNQTLEPTQIAGFNQFFDDTDGSETERYGVAVDAKLSPNLFSGVEFSWRKLELPSFDEDTEITTFKDQEEKFHRAYFNWTTNAGLAFSLEGFLEDFDISDGALRELTTYRYPIGISYHSSFGLFVKATGTHVNQKIERSGERQSDSFWVVDLSTGYRLPKRFGTITFGVKNLFDEQFNFQDYNFNADEPLTPYYIPEALLFGQITLAF